jgi:hypothetical protein
LIVDKIDRFLKITQGKNGIREFEKDRKESTTTIMKLTPVYV